MPIQAGDIKLVASQVMGDVPEGGGAPTATVILDGASNAIFPDISELDRAGGRVNLRKLHVSVQTPDTDTYLGSNVIVAEPPTDPNVTVTLFSTNDVFDRRVAAASRVESYLIKGPQWAGFLLENHIAGQRVIQLLQRPDSEEPNVGQTLVLVLNEETPNEVLQYVRTTEVTSVTRLFYDAASNSDFLAKVVSCRLSDSLRYDFKGSPASRSFSANGNATLTRDTVVADASVYAGISPLKTAAQIGDFTVAVESVYTQLVPSAQTETPILDVRTNGLSTALVPTGGPLTQDITMGFNPSTNMFVGGPISPGSLSVVRDSVTVTDRGGVLIAGSAEVGQVDYDNGILKLSTAVWSSAGEHTVTFIPATVPDLISDQRAVLVTAESRSLNYVLTLDDIPVPRSLSISYLAQGRWYVLRDDGSGVLRGISPSFGVGTLSYSTGSLSVTLGVLPDVGSALILQSYSKATTVGSSNTELLNGGRAYAPINTSGLLSEEKGEKTIKAGAMSITWLDGGVTKTATDNGAGQLVGHATGNVNYSLGTVLLSPNALPAPGTVFTMVADTRTKGVAVGVTLAGGNLGAVNIIPGSVSFELPITIHYARVGGSLQFLTRMINAVIVDDSAGNLCFYEGGTKNLCGTITYATGAIAVVGGNLNWFDMAGPMIYNTWYQYAWNELGEGLGGRTFTHAPSGNVSYSNAAAESNTVAVTVPQYLIRSMMVPDYTLKGVGFKLGATRYQQLTDGTLNKDVDPMTGGGIPAGVVSGPLGAVVLTSWPAGVSPVAQDWRGLISPPTTGVRSPFSAFSTILRTATSPLRPGSFSILGTMQDGTTFNVTAGTDGVINGTRVKGRVNYAYGLVELYFVNPNGNAEVLTDFAFLNIPGLTTASADLVMLATLRYNAVGFSYLPLDAALLGIDPVRLPSDGRVPIYRAGGFAVVGNTKRITATVSNGQVIDCARVRLSRVRIVGSDGLVINTGYSADLESGLVTINSTAGYAQPITIEHRIEDMAVVREVQISGEITFTRRLTHNYPLEGSYVSSALVSQDLKARVSIFFDQATWDSATWVDAVTGSSATATYNDVLSPLVVTNIGAVTERWALRFTSATAYQLIGEHVGVIGSGNTATVYAPINPATGSPYVTINPVGFGLGWAVGNVIRFNTVGAMYPVWVVRTIQQGAESVQDDSFTLLVRGDVDRP